MGEENFHVHKERKMGDVQEQEIINEDGNKLKHVFLVGAKGIGFYGGYETFVNKLVEHHQNNPQIKYHIACKANGQGSMDEKKLEHIEKINEKEFLYKSSHCFQVDVNAKLGSAQALIYDIDSLKVSLEIIKRDKIEQPIVYMMTCRIGPWFGKYVKRIHQLNGKVYLNPDGHEWKRAKWNWLVKKYWKISERLMVTKADLVVCDRVNIEKYIKEKYKKIKTIFIAYGCEMRKSFLEDGNEKFLSWLKKKELSIGDYYLIVGRFVPENNYETIIREFMESKSQRNLAIVTTENPQFYKALEQKLGFKKDKRIRFVGTVYDQELLMKIRENAYGYLHGHEVGGTNPSLLEPLGTTK